MLEIIQSGFQLCINGRAEVLDTRCERLSLHGQATPMLLLAPLAHTEPACVIQQVPWRLQPQEGGDIYLILGPMAAVGT